MHAGLTSRDFIQYANWETLFLTYLWFTHGRKTTEHVCHQNVSLVSPHWHWEWHWHFVFTIVGVGATNLFILKCFFVSHRLHYFAFNAFLLSTGGSVANFIQLPSSSVHWHIKQQSLSLFHTYIVGNGKAECSTNSRFYGSSPYVDDTNIILLQVED